jgi:ribosomal protein S18 acetylase RimI-like enzyme
VWSWIHRTAQVRAVLLIPDSKPDDPRGLAHLRPWVRPLRAEVAGYLDDLFIDPEARGQGGVEALFDGIKALARDEGWRLVRWTTAEDNYRARAAYDRLASRTDWITYDLTV